jgi:hypothetical protein
VAAARPIKGAYSSPRPDAITLRAVEALVPAIDVPPNTTRTSLMPGGLHHQAFAKMKTLLRKADARTIDETWRTIGALLDCFTPKECANYFRNAGYASA